MNFFQIKYKLTNFVTQICIDIIVKLNGDSSYISHCKREVPDWLSEDEGPNLWIAKGTIELLSVLSHQGHSGSSIGFALEFFKQMALFKPWGPLTGDASEWVEVSDGLWQNKRMGSVFKGDDGVAYRSDGKIYHDGDNFCYTSNKSRVNITFPYSVTDPEIIDTTK